MGGREGGRGGVVFLVFGFGGGVHSARVVQLLGEVVFDIGFRLG